MRRFAIGDIHGAHRALIQCLERAGFDKESDLLIGLGDVADGWNEVRQSIEELISIPNYIHILGNHDIWLLNYLEVSATPDVWTQQGGWATIESYGTYHGNLLNTIKRHREFLKRGHYYYVLDNKLFIHGGYNWHKPISETSNDQKMWDRHLFETAVYWHKLNVTDKMPNRVKDYDEVFIGHTATNHIFKHTDPIHVANVWNLDQGAGWDGKLTIMDIDSKEYWQSDIVTDLYKDEKNHK